MRLNRNRIVRFARVRAFRFPALTTIVAAVVFFAAIRPLPAAAQQQPVLRPNPRAFVGTWTASFEGKTFMKLHFAMKNGKLTGRMSNGEVTMNADGSIAAVTVSPGEDPVTILKVEHNTVYMLHGAKHPLHFVVRLQDKTHAEIEILSPSPAGVAKPKPIVLVKQVKKR